MLAESLEHWYDKGKVITWLPKHGHATAASGSEWRAPSCPTTAPHRLGAGNPSPPTRPSREPPEVAGPLTMASGLGRSSIIRDERGAAAACPMARGRARRRL
ncbi:hypothetical protein GCM10010377_55990 [Streptomyces viridiviolaceus]|nr:hypothetical protein GCM10010377_55990 [Streptomyces viridiviolaceus]